MSLVVLICKNRAKLLIFFELCKKNRIIQKSAVVVVVKRTPLIGLLGRCNFFDCGAYCLSDTVAHLGCSEVSVVVYCAEAFEGRLKHFVSVIVYHIVVYEAECAVEQRFGIVSVAIFARSEERRVGKECRL